jgi:hypothetical protein
MSATAKQTLNLPQCPGIDRNKPFIRAAFGKRYAPPKIEAQNFHGPSCAVLTRTLASVIGGNATESLKTEFHEKEVETVPANVSN